jgi:hypothetical protein
MLTASGNLAAGCLASTWRSARQGRSRRPPPIRHVDERLSDGSHHTAVLEQMRIAASDALQRCLNRTFDLVVTRAGMPRENSVMNK